MDVFLVYPKKCALFLLSTIPREPPGYFAMLESGKLAAVLFAGINVKFVLQRKCSPENSVALMAQIRENV